jgi:hypothetical protein
LECKAVKEEVGESAAVSAIFDCTPKVGEVFCVVSRFIKKSHVTHHMVALRLYAHAFDYQQLAEAVVDILVYELEIPRTKLRAEISDDCSVNGAAVELIRIMFRHVIHMTCISYGANIIGKVVLQKDNCPLPLLRKFE